MDPTTLARLIADVPDFPSPGVVFKDITPLLSSPNGLAGAVEALLTTAPPDVDVVLGLEARGFIFAAPVALGLGAGFVPARKPDKLPRESLRVDVALEYGTTTLALYADAFPPGARVLIVDDVLATGGTVSAAAELVRRLGGQLVGVSVLIELLFLHGRARLAGEGVERVASVIQVSRE
jgi:adenine phosphoribosyltransferase